MTARGSSLVTRTRRPHRRGSTYVLTLAVALIVAVIGLSSITVARLGMRGEMRTADGDRADLIASAAVERVLAVIGEQDAWRDQYVHGEATAEEPFGGGTMSVRVVDLSGDDDLAAGDDDPVAIFGTGRVGDVVRVRSVRLDTRSPVSALAAAVWAGGNLSLGDPEVHGEGVLGANASVNAISTTVFPPVEAAGSITGGTYAGTTTLLATPRDLPDAATVFDHYLANGTVIPITTLPTAAGYRQISGVLLSPTSNPYGDNTTNPAGIYVIDCAGEDLRIWQSRIVGTLVLLNAGPRTRVMNWIIWEPAVPNYPIALVQGTFDLRYESTETLLESDVGLNLNPPGVPFEGETDADMADAYPVELRGLIFATGTITIVGSTTVKGLMLSTGAIDHVSGVLDVRHDQRYAIDPPPGFMATTRPLSVVAGTWRWETAD